MKPQAIAAYVLIGIDCFSAILLSILIILQGGKIRGIGSAIAGTSDSSLFTNEKLNYAKEYSNSLIGKVGTFFVVLTFIISILLSKHVIILS